MFLSYLMGAGRIADPELTNLGIEIAERFEDGDRGLRIPAKAIDNYRRLLKSKMDPGFWNEWLDEKDVFFLFKFKDGHVAEYRLSPGNEREIDALCAEFAGEPLGEGEAGVYGFLAKNDYYRDFVIEHFGGKLPEG